MGERKVLNKYFPPDFDPAKIPRRKFQKNNQIKVRMMLPMTVRCNTCGTYIYKGTKFNSRKEDAVGETYLGIQIFRLYFKCTNCSAEITIKTDPQNLDYVVETGAGRNFEPWRAEDEVTEIERRRRDAEEMGDAMKTLENKARDSKRDMDTVAALEEMKSINARHETGSNQVLVEILKQYAISANLENGTEEAEEAVIKSIVFRNSKDFVRRVEEDDDEDFIEEDQASYNLEEPEDRKLKRKTMMGNCKPGDGATLVCKPKFILKPRAASDGTKRPRVSPADGVSATEQTKGSVLQSLCANYDSEEE